MLITQHPLGGIVDCTQCIFGPFLSSSFFPPNDSAQNHAQENPLLVLFLLAQKCLEAKKVKMCKTNILF
jgi:hypothetical protein